MVGEKVINKKVVDVEWGSVVICVEFWELYKYSFLGFILREKR